MNDVNFAAEQFFKGLHALSARDFTTAEGHFLEALKIIPDRPSVLTNLSVVYAEQGRLTEALELAETAVEKTPEDPLCLLQLGSVQLKLRRYRDSLQSIDSVLQIDGAIPQAYNNRGNALKELGRIDEALASYDKAISLKPDYAEAFNNRGYALKELGRVDEALASYDKAISLKPDYAEAFSNRGNALKELGRVEEALASYDKAISLRPDYAEAFGNRGNALQELGKIDEALASYDKAISLKPEYAKAWLGLASVTAEMGRFREAELNYLKARSLDPEAVAPLVGIAEVKTFVASDPLIQELEKLLSTSLLSDEDRARLHYAYGKVCNDLGRHEEAINNFSLGKRLLKSKFNIEQHREWYSAMKQIFTEEFFAERAGFGLSDERPVFIVGMPRSGTTLTEQILASHHLVDGLGELQVMPEIARKWCGSKNPISFAKSVTSLTAADVKAMAESYLKVYTRSKKASIRLTDKRPHNYEWLGIIALMFPNAHIVHCRREPLDNCVSMYMQKFNESHGYNQDLTTLGHYYREYQSLMDHWSASLPSTIHDQIYEDAVSDIETSSRSLISFLGLEWDQNCLNYHQQDRQVSTPSLWQVRQPLYDKAVGRWRLYEGHLGALKKALQKSEY